MADDGTQYRIEELGNVHIVNDRIYEHKTMRVNYRTYDLQQEYDIVNSRKHANILTVSPLFDHVSHTSSDGHPFRYARVLGIYHANIVYFNPITRSSLAQTMEFLLVHWYRRDSRYKAGFKRRRLHRLELLAPDDPEALGFLDPDDVIRGSHLIPAFAHGVEEGWALPSVTGVGKEAWQFYYVNWCVSYQYGKRFYELTATQVLLTGICTCVSAEEGWGTCLRESRTQRRTLTVG